MKNVVKESSLPYQISLPPPMVHQESNPESKENTDIEYNDQQDQELDDLCQNVPYYLSLSYLQRKILMFIVYQTFTEDKCTDTEIAEKFGINRRTIGRLRLNDRFIAAYNYLIRELAKNLTGEMVNNLKNLAKTQVGAAKLMLEYTGEYVPRSQQSIISHQIRHNVSSDDAKSPQAAIVDFVAFLGGVGYDKDRLIAEVSAAYDALKAENAF